MPIVLLACSQQLRLHLVQHLTPAIRTPQAYSTATASAAAPFSHALVTSPAAQRAVGAWLFGGAAWVFSMVVLGGVTRLTRSGLSMTDWKFTGEAAPRTEADWDAEFAKYRASPEFQKVNRRMTVEEFKFIYWMEYAHRMWGRVLGIYFALPVAYFAARGYVTGALGCRLALLFAAGGSQGLVGWWMVKSGLEQPRSEHEVPRVSPYRLATHLSTAFAIYAGILWTALSVAWPTPPLAAEGLSPERVARALALRARAHPLAGLIALTAASGAFVAGLDAGHAYNTFPLMGGRVIPEEYWDASLPAWRNALENTAAVQFHHRVLALSTLGAVGGTWAGAFAASAAPLPAAVATATHALFAAAAGQVTLGIATLLSCVPVWLGAAHQAGALMLFSVALCLLHTLRAPPAVKAKARAAAVQAAAKLA